MVNSSSAKQDADVPIVLFGYSFLGHLIEISGYMYLGSEMPDTVWVCTGRFLCHEFSYTFADSLEFHDLQSNILIGVSKVIEKECWSSIKGMQKY